MIISISHYRTVCVLVPFILLSKSEGYNIKFLCCSCSTQVDKNQIFEEMEKSRLKISCPLMASFLLDEMKNL